MCIENLGRETGAVYLQLRASSHALAVSTFLPPVSELCSPTAANPSSAPNLCARYVRATGARGSEDRVLPLLMVQAAELVI